MGLDTTHDCWHGAYRSFMLWRTQIAKAAGITLRLMEGFCDPLPAEAPPIRWCTLRSDPLHVLLNHSDCDGSIAWQDCGPLADRLEQLLPLLPKERDGVYVDWTKTTKRFIRGLRRAATAQEDVEFH